VPVSSPASPSVVGGCKGNGSDARACVLTTDITQRMQERRNVNAMRRRHCTCPRNLRTCADACPRVCALVVAYVHMHGVVRTRRYLPRCAFHRLRSMRICCARCWSIGSSGGTHIHCAAVASQCAHTPARINSAGNSPTHCD